MANMRGREHGFRILRLLCKGHYEQKLPGMVTWSFDDLLELREVLDRLTEQMARLHRHHNIPYQTNRRINEEVAQLIECTLEPNLEQG